MSLFFDEINKNNYKNKWLELCLNDSLISYFYLVDKEVRVCLELYYIYFKDYNCEDLDNDDMVILSYINNKVDDLLKKSKKCSLSINERMFLSRLLGGCVLYNKDISRDRLTSYVNNCYLTNKESIFSSDLLILLKHTFNYLNEINNLDVNFKMKSISGDFGQFMFSYNTMKNYLFINRENYDVSFTDVVDVISLEEFSNMLVSQTNILLHEFRHYMQNKVNVRDSYTWSEERMKKEFKVLSNNSDFYKKYYESFFIERDANSFASSNLEYIIGNFLLDEYYDEAILARLISNDNKVSDINKLVDEEYKKYTKKR